jgi:hypothetical protein
MGNKKLKIILFSLLGVILVGGLVVAGFQVRKSQQQVLITLTPTPSLSIIPTEPITPTPTLKPASTIAFDQTADWKTYTNTKHNFSVKYPIDWTVKDVFDPTEALSLVMELHTADRDYFNGTAIDVFLSYELESVNQSRLRGIGIDIASAKDLKTDNLSGTLYETDGIGEGGSGYRMDFLFKEKSKHFWFYLATGLNNKTVGKNTFLQILSTFRFLD